MRVNDIPKRALACYQIAEVLFYKQVYNVFYKHVADKDGNHPEARRLLSFPIF